MISSPPSTSAPTEAGRAELRRRRDALAEQVAELHWDLGGLTYEMAIRDHFRLDVLVRRAAMLQERDAELAEIERLLRLEESASAGSCPHCAAPHSRGALFCWQCGATLMERSPSAVAAPSMATPSMATPSTATPSTASPNTEAPSTAPTSTGPPPRQAGGDGSPTAVMRAGAGGEEEDRPTAVLDALLAPPPGE